MNQIAVKGIQTAVILAFSSLFFVFCNPAKRAASGGPSRPGGPVVRPSDRPGAPETMDTVRWTPAPSALPPIGDAPALPAETPYTGQTYRMALLLPFLADQAGPDAQTVPEKSRLALQFYAGANLALKQLSETEGMNLVVDVLDTRVSDLDFQRLFANPSLQKAQVIIGPIRSSHVSLMAERIKQTRQILVSPETPNMDLTAQNPDFIQTNPSLRAHCTAIVRYILQRHRPDAVTLVCKQREATRLPYLQQANAPGAKPFAELIVPDDATTFDNIDLRPYFKAGRTAVFILPTWASQDFVMAFFRKLRASRGANAVEVYGMPQWKNFENIEPEYFADLNVHISSAFYVDRDTPEARAFRQAFYDAFGTVPDDDAYNGYDVTLFTGRMLKRYGLSFPQRLAAAEPFVGLHTPFQFAKVFNTPPDLSAGNRSDQLDRFDYLENIFVHILAFDNYRFVPAE